VLACLSLPVLALSSCGGDSNTPANAQPSPKVTVEMLEESYRPATVRIPVGGRVTWVSGGDASNTAETGGAASFETDRNKLDRLNVFDIHTIQPAEAESVEFDTPGRYRYGSSFSDALGVVEVVEEDR
jgi:plastocyanin